MESLKKKKAIEFKNLTLHWSPPILWIGFIYLLPFLTSDGPSLFLGFDKIVHLIEYGFLAVFFYRAFYGTGFNSKISRTKSFFLTFTFGLVDETHQIFVPTRTASIWDLVFDTMGGALALLFIWTLLPKMPTKLKNLAKKLHLI